MESKIVDSKVYSLKELFSSKFDVDFYQREYVWNRKQIEDLILDLSSEFMKNWKQGDPLSKVSSYDPYYMGEIVLSIKDEHNSIIDGQQRTTTFTLILLTLHSLFSTVCTNPNDPLIIDVKRLLWQHSKTRYPEKEFPSLKLNSIEKEAFSELYDYAFDTPQTLYSFAENYTCKSDYEKRVIENFKLIYDTLSKTVCEDENKLLDYASYVIENINFINIECTDNVNKVFSIFESINSKGKPLEEIDKIKCFIFSELDEKS